MDAPSKPTLHPLAGKKVIVAGAGIAGLAFVISLKSLWKPEMGLIPDIVHYERDREPSDASRAGYSVSLRSDDLSPGMQALRKMDVLNAVLDAGITRRESVRGYLGLWSLDWRRLVRIRDIAQDGLPIPGMRIPRSKLRDILLRTASEYGNVTWGIACTHILSSTGTGIRVRLNNGEDDLCDFLVVADGANSKLRASIRPDDGLNFTGAVSISATARFFGSPPEPVCRDWGMIASGQGIALFASPMDEQSAFWSLSYKASIPREQCRRPLTPHSNEKLLQEARKRGTVFREPFQTLLDHSDPNTVMISNAMDKQPFAHNAANSVPGGVCFIGDSNHAISQFAGTGANMALLDGYDLAECLSSHETIVQALEAYDNRSMPRASTSVRNARFCIDLVHSTGLSWQLSRTVLIMVGAMFSMWNLVLLWTEKFTL